MHFEKFKHTFGNNQESEFIGYRGYLKFPISKWNKKEKTPIIEVRYSDYKKESGWWLDDKKTKWYTYPPHKNCEIKFFYFTRHPEIKLYSSTRDTKVKYEDFTINYCLKQAMEIFKDRLNDVFSQLDTLTTGEHF